MAWTLNIKQGPVEGDCTQGKRHGCTSNCSSNHIISVITGFLGRLGLLSLLQQSEGNTLAATEFIRLLEASGSVTAKRSNGTREKTQLIGSNSRV